MFYVRPADSRNGDRRNARLPQDMVDRWHRLRDNVGTGAAVRTLLVAAAFAVIAIAYTLDRRDPAPPIAFVAGFGAPWLLRRALIARIETTQLALRLLGVAIVAAAFVGGWVRGELWAEGTSTEGWLFAGLVAVVAIYVSTFFWAFSDPEVVRLE